LILLFKITEKGYPTLIIYQSNFEKKSKAILTRIDEKIYYFLTRKVWVHREVMRDEILNISCLFSLIIIPYYDYFSSSTVNVKFSIEIKS